MASLVDVVEARRKAGKCVCWNCLAPETQRPDWVPADWRWLPGGLFRKGRAVKGRVEVMLVIGWWHWRERHGYDDYGPWHSAPAENGADFAKLVADHLGRLGVR